jgi:hypothetical protein
MDHRGRSAAAEQERQPMKYEEFIASKFRAHQPSGIDRPMPEYLFPHQRALTSWALRRGRAAIFADTGLGKMLMELVWASAVHEYTRMPVMIHAPLAVTRQIEREADRFNLTATVVADQSEVVPGINITNYDKLHRFNTSVFGGIVLDESGCIKHHDAKTFRLLTDAYLRTPFKLPASATPAPNDFTELGTHAEFLGICSRSEMLAEFFTHDGGETSVWRLKKHAKGLFWRWVASWAAMVRKPSDLGFDNHLYDLPPLQITEHQVETRSESTWTLFPMEAQTLSERRDARRRSLSDRVTACAQIVNKSSDAWVIWCDLNDEGDALESAISDAVQIAGRHSNEIKEQRLLDFAQGTSRVLISKPSICGWGLNWQHCHNIAFVGVTDSYEAYYQSVRRCWRFGQTKPVNVHLFVSAEEGSVSANLRRKEKDAKIMAEALTAETAAAVFAEVRGLTRETNAHLNTKTACVPDFLRR